ncbi:hypothetical protein [Paenibacillus radicis (ex Xue et al. 2023)]|uniref:Uncharacterized protein n=1 Tax=Paenibacillus radicis (ex Xue et al. 2023) TaxID=2972489 RepID=A0ABT1YH90_9BACL|nr:hypothetical protein [Paenibacillus radicis (ex Xue et al. 2023)]MCR8632560.1 hypothetical protein [Paenibacillus radicis (ex Xue et al. 2023)]
MGWLKHKNKGTVALTAGLAVLFLAFGIWILFPMNSSGNHSELGKLEQKEQPLQVAEGTAGTDALKQPAAGEAEPIAETAGGPEAAIDSPEQSSEALAGVDSAEDELYSLIERDKLNYLRIGDSDSYWDYKPQDKIFYSDPEANIFVSLTIPDMSSKSQEDYEALRRGVKVLTASGEPVAFTVEGQNSRGDEDQQVVIHLKDAPKQPLQVKFTSKDGKRSKIIELHYIEKLSYKVHSEQDSGLEKAFRVSFPEGVSMPRRMDAAVPYQLQADFSADMDRGSVEEVLGKQLANVKRTLEWKGNRSLKLTIEFAESNIGQTYFFSMAGARSMQGLELKQNEHMMFIPVSRVEVKAADLSTQHTASLFSGLNNFDTLSVSPDGQWGLMGEYVENQMYAELVYTLVDHQGQIIRSFDYAEVGYPQWLMDGHTLIYMKHTMKRQEVWLYNASTREERLFWKVPDAADDKSNQQRIVAIAVDPYSGEIAIGAGAFNEEAEISVGVQWFASSQETKPGKTFKDISRYTCYEGPCSAWIQFIGKSKLYFTTINSLWPQAYPEAYIMDTATGKKSKVDGVERTGGYSEYRQLVPGSNNGIYLRIDQQENGNEVWKIYDVKTGKSSEWQTDLKLLKQAPFTGFHLEKDGRIVFLTKEKSWYAADPTQKTVMPYTNDLLPKSSEIVKTYGSERNILWFGTDSRTRGTE